MTDRDDAFFIGWRDDSPKRSRRLLLTSGLGLLACAAGAGAGGFMSTARSSARYGSWDQGAERDWTGILHTSPYPLLRTRDIDGRPRTAFLAEGGKTGLRVPAEWDGRAVTLRGSLIARGEHAMIALSDPRSLAAKPQATLDGLADWPEAPRGEALLIGEFLDAKCWFGAMRPGLGLTHKACAALCIRGGLPLAFCTGDVCDQGGQALLLLDEHGRAHGGAILPLVADRIAVRGHVLQVGDVLQLRASIAGMRRV